MTICPPTQDNYTWLCVSYLQIIPLMSVIVTVTTVLLLSGRVIHVMHVEQIDLLLQRGILLLLFVFAERRQFTNFL